MQQLLIIKLHNYITENNPDLLLALQQHNALSRYLEEKVAGIEPLIDELSGQGCHQYDIEEQCLEELTADLRPSRYLYLRDILAEEFEHQYQTLLDTGLAAFELINLLTACKEVFDSHGFTSENEDDSYLRYAITGSIQEYFENRSVTTEN